MVESCIYALGGWLSAILCSLEMEHTELWMAQEYLQHKSPQKWLWVLFGCSWIYYERRSREYTYRSSKFKVHSYLVDHACALRTVIYNIQVIKNIKNVAGCRDTRTAKSKETRGMIEHNSEVYNHPYRDLLPYIHVQWKKICRGDCILHCYVDHPSCFLTFCRSGIPTSCYIFNVFLLLVYVIFLAAGACLRLSLLQKSVTSQAPEQ